jgi:hypothetical protein
LGVGTGDIRRVLALSVHNRVIPDLREEKMLIQDIAPRYGFSAYFEKYLEKRRIELAKLMGTYRKIEVIDPDLQKIQLEHNFSPNIFGFCECSDCYGDFSGASYDEWGGR